MTDPVTQMTDSVTQLKSVRRLIAEHSASDEPLTQAALHLIDCATDVVGQLPRGGDLESARAALGSARAAVITATYAVRRIHDLSKAEQT